MFGFHYRTAPQLVTRNLFRSFLHPARRMDGRLRGCLQAGGVQEAEAISPHAGNQPAGFEDAEHATGHLPARTDQGRKVCPRENWLLRKEQVGVDAQHASHPSRRVLVQKAVEPPYGRLERRENVVQRVDREPGVGRRE